jgi:hypothetical protein
MCLSGAGGGGWGAGAAVMADPFPHTSIRLVWMPFIPGNTSAPPHPPQVHLVRGELDFNELLSKTEAEREAELACRMEKYERAQQRADTIAQAAAAKRRRLDEGPRYVDVEARQASTFNIGLESRTCSTQQGSNSRPADAADSDAGSDQEETDDVQGEASNLRRSTRARAGGVSLTHVSWAFAFLHVLRLLVYPCH